MNALGTFISVILTIVVCCGRRKWATLAMMAGVLFLTQAQAVDVLGLNIFAIRFLEVAGFFRVILRREFSLSSLNRIDRAFLVLYSYTTTVFLLRSNEGQVYQIGLTVDAILCYFTFRGLIGSTEDFRWLLRAFVFLLAPYVVLVSFERLTAQNPFALVGAEAAVSYFRDGVPRCIGSFRHPDLLGTLGATFLPLYIGLCFKKSDRTRSLLGITLSIWIVWIANAGGPLAATAAGLIAWALWGMRMKMATIRRVMLVMIIFLAMVMKAPIWYLPAKLTAFTGGDGYHRSVLINAAVEDFEKWWFAGMSIGDTQNWLPYSHGTTGGADITNQFLGFGLAAGIGAIALLISLLVLSFQHLGKMMESFRSSSSETNANEFLIWGLGVALFVHIVNWLGVSYFDQTYVIWFMQLAAISGISQERIGPI